MNIFLTIILLALVYNLGKVMLSNIKITLMVIGSLMVLFLPFTWAISCGVYQGLTNHDPKVCTFISDSRRN